jgi:hypothetical protein
VPKKVKQNQWRFKFWFFRHGDKRMFLNFRGQDYLVSKIECYAPSESKFQKHPQCLVQGYAESVHFRVEDGKKIAVIV